MSIVIQKNTLHKILFTICIGVPYLNNYELTFLVWATTLVFTIKKTYSLVILKFILPYIAIMLLGLFSMFFYKNNIYEVIRDITYLSKPILGMLLGYQLYRNHKIKAIETIIYAGLFIAVIHFLIIFYSALTYKIANIHSLRRYTGYFSDFEVYSLILVIFHKHFDVFLTKKRYWTLVIIIGLSTVLYVSRTNFIQFVIFYLALKGYFTLNKKTIRVLASFIAISLISYAIIYNSNFSRHGSGLEALMYKIKNAPIEAFKTKVDKDDWQDFNDNFRSYENIITVQQVSNEGVFAIVLGKGLGATVDLGREVRTNDDTYVRYEAILHNAFMTVFLKSGLIGVFFMFYFIYILIKQKKSNDFHVKQINLLFVATGIFLLFENWVLLGLFLKTESKSVLLGFIICYREYYIKEKNSKGIEE
jgi:hypothetical protein